MRSNGLYKPFDSRQTDFFKLFFNLIYPFETESALHLTGLAKGLSSLQTEFLI